MKILEFYCDDNMAMTGDLEKLSAKISRHIEKMTNEYADAVADGWRVIIEMCSVEEYPHDADRYFYLDVQSDQGGGDYAEAKMSTLHFSDLAATGLEEPMKFAKWLANSTYIFNGGDNGDRFERSIDRICELDYIEQMPRDVAEYLRELGLTSYKGAIRAPYEISITEDDDDHKSERGEIRIAFSGAEEWQDLFFATSILSCVQRTLESDDECLIACMQQIEPLDDDSSMSIKFDLHGLQDNPQTNMWLKLLKLT